jgi:hypothetical protein
VLFKGRENIFSVLPAPFSQTKERVAEAPIWRRTYTEILLTKGHVAIDFVLKRRALHKMCRAAGKIFLAKLEWKFRRARFNRRSSSIYEELNRMRT